jgi:uncharacterized membrane protein YqiK
MATVTRTTLQRRLNTATKGTAEAHLGDVIYDLIAALNDLKAKHAALLTKLDTANVAGIGNNNTATVGSTVAPVMTPEQRQTAIL